MTQPGIPLGHTIPAHRAFGWCSHCPDHTVAEELAAWQTREPIDVSPGPAAEIDRLRTANERMRHELEVMYGGAFDKLPEPAAVSAAVTEPTDPTHGLSVPHADALWDAVAIPGPRTPTYPEQHERVCRAVRDILDELTPAPADRAALRDRIAEALMQWAEGNNSPKYASMRRPATVVQNAYSRADAVLAVLPSAGCLTPEYTDGPCHCPSCDPAAHRTDRAAVLADVERAIRTATRSCGYKAEDGCDFCNGVDAALDQVRRMADETATETPTAVDLPTLAAALDGLDPLIATSSRDWGTYRVDAWLWAVLCGWDCEQTEHDETCVHGALEETAAMHGWDEATVAKARRYRAAVRAVTEQQPAAGARQDGTPDVQTQPATPMTAHLTTPCDACNHTLNWHSSGETGCTVPRCACARYYHAAGARQDGDQS